MTQEGTQGTITVRRSLRSRVGCGAAVIIWCFILLIPGMCFVLAVQGELALWPGPGIPESASHPLLQIKLIMDADSRGVSITRSSVATQDESQLCVQTNVNFLLWQGEGDPASYCECYVPAGSATTRDGWIYDTTTTGACEP